MNREARRAEAKKLKRKSSGLRSKKTDVFISIRRSSPMTSAEARSISVPVQVSWLKICEGNGDIICFSDVVWALSLVEHCLNDKKIEGVEEYLDSAANSLARLREEFLERKTFTPTLEDKSVIDTILDLHDQVLHFLSPLQLNTMLGQIEEKRDKFVKKEKIS